MVRPLLTAAQAKKRVFDHWNHLNALSRRRFPNDENLALEGLDYVLRKLEADDWRRVRTWEGQSDFLVFITTIGVRLLTDFSRKKFGYIRTPSWLKAKNDPLWNDAYELLIVKHCTQQETIESLRVREAGIEYGYLKELVATIRGGCQKQRQFTEERLSLRESTEKASARFEPEVALIMQEAENLEALVQSLMSNDDLNLTPPVRELLARLKSHVQLTEEDRLLLQMYHVDGLSMPTIAKLLNLKGDPYKRYKKIIKHLREACRQIGLLAN